MTDKVALAGARVAPLASVLDQSGNGIRFGEVVSFVNQHSELLVLSDDRSGASIAVWPAMQGRVLTSSVAGANGKSFGWVNRGLIGSGKIQEHINAVGGEDRIWLGPEGGQFSIFFAPGVPFDLDHWFTPAPLDTEAFDLVSREQDLVVFRKAFHLINYSGTGFDVQIDREVRLLKEAQVWQDLQMPALSDVMTVGFESLNKLTNLGGSQWSKAAGMVSLWVLGQFQSSPSTWIVLPIQEGSSAELGIPVTADYFGNVPAGRIVVRPDAILLKADSNYRCKLGLSLPRSKGILGSYDAQNCVLTVVQYSQPSEPADYLNSAWKIQEDPYRGDVTNCYNDGPPEPGKAQLGSFYELESSSPAKALKPNESIAHMQRTLHLVGAEAQLNKVAKAALGVSLKVITEFNY